MTGQLYLIQNKCGEFLIRKRSEKGLLHGLWEFPWQQGEKLKEKLPSVTHVFTHIKLTLQIVRQEKEKSPFDRQGERGEKENY